MNMHNDELAVYNDGEAGIHFAPLSRDPLGSQRYSCFHSIY